MIRRKLERFLTAILKYKFSYFSCIEIFKKSAQAVLIENSDVFDRKIQFLKNKKLFHYMQGTANKRSALHGMSLGRD